MPRDGSGNYTLPAGNPVVIGTLIESSWANSTLSDIATQLNNVITRDGLLGPVNPFKLIDGSQSAPGLAFNSEPGLGLYRIGGNQLGFAAANSTFMWTDASDVGRSYLKLFPRTSQPSGGAQIDLYRNPFSGATGGFGSISVGLEGLNLSYFDQNTSLNGPIRFIGSGFTFSNQFNSVIGLEKGNTGYSSALLGSRGGSSRWLLELGNADTEGGSNTGSHFLISRYDDSGIIIDSPLTIFRSTGLIQVGNSRTLQFQGSSGGFYADGVTSGTSQPIGMAWTGSQVGVRIGSVNVGGLTPSDMRLKKNVKPISVGLNEVLATEVFEFEYDQEKSPLGLPLGLRYGFDAGKVKQSFAPAVGYWKPFVNDESVVFFQLDEKQLVPALFRSIQQMYERLDTRLRNLEASV